MAATDDFGGGGTRPVHREGYSARPLESALRRARAGHALSTAEAHALVDRIEELEAAAREGAA